MSLDSRVAAVSVSLLLAWSNPGDAAPRKGKKEPQVSSASALLVVDCYLPSQIRKIGRRRTYLMPRRLIRTTSRDCEIRGGEQLQDDPAAPNNRFAVWLAKAIAGDPEAQTIVGEMLQSGQGTGVDYEEAARWYRKAADQGDGRAQTNLAILYEKGLGVERDMEEAFRWYREAGGLSGAIAIDSRDQIINLEEVQKLREQVGQLGLQKEELERKLEHAQFELEEMSRSEEELERQLEDLRIQLSKEHAATSRDEKRLKELQRELQKTASELATVQSEKAQSNARIEELTEDKVRVGGLSKGTEEQLSRILGESELSEVRQAAARRSDANPDFALLIANSEYQRLPKVETAHSDARDIAEVLRGVYGFQTEILQNATRSQMEEKVAEFGKKKGNLLIYYSGHGRLSEDERQGYWLPVDAGERPETWVSTQWLSEYLAEVVEARGVLVMADSCFKDPKQRETSGLAGLGVNPAQKARIAIISGSLEPRPARAGERSSAFAQALLSILTENREVLDFSALVALVRGRAASAVALFLQGHAMGEFSLRPVSRR